MAPFECTWWMNIPVTRKSRTTVPAVLEHARVCLEWRPRELDIPPRDFPPGDPPFKIDGLSQEETRNVFTLGTIGGLATSLGPQVGAEINRAVEVQMKTLNAKLGEGVEIVRANHDNSHKA
jgi:hypothetical protein